MTELHREQVAARVTEALVETFELPPEDVTPDARLYDDLDLDSIDAIDLVVKLELLTGLKLTEDDVRAIRTVGDVIDTVHSKLDAGAVAVAAADEPVGEGQGAARCEPSSS